MELLLLFRGPPPPPRCTTEITDKGRCQEDAPINTAPQADPCPAADKTSPPRCTSVWGAQTTGSGLILNRSGGGRTQRRWLIPFHRPGVFSHTAGGHRRINVFLLQERIASVANANARSNKRSQSEVAPSTNDSEAITDYLGRLLMHERSWRYECSLITA